ncbi:ABC transporter ATP-binding protein [Hespellia stercorisuis]|uniref:ABC-type multidrug transport system, ATPase and permease component n=1 Tax=Hespellia stercorisuis DSM 15480 TaxID=1121950 RepID=A0A1M6U9Z0_9FIRM|nr:ABC transporter ATP-binding protein [Hespellia stercorisuis]SHK65980.1 ABC-type multidrug transport system, ATPase and permease component [Hespellia stercorisuis DSM 15480]
MKQKTDRSTLRWISNVAGKKKLYIVILLLVQVVLGISSVFYAFILRSLIDAAVAGNRDKFFLTVVALAGLVLFQILLRAINRFFEEYSRAAMENGFKSRLLSFLLREDYGRITAIHSGEWMNRLTSDTVVVADGLAQIVPGVAGMLVKMCGALVMILVLEPRFGFILIPGGVLLVVLTYGFRKVLKRFHKQMQEADGTLRVFLQERLASMLVVRAFVKEEQTIQEAEELMETHKKARMKKNHFSNVCNIGFGGVMQGAYVLGAGVCGYGILTGTMSYGTLMAILQLIGQIQSPFANITGYLPKYYAMLASAERLREVELFSDGNEVTSVPDVSNGNHSIMSISGIQDFYREHMTAICLEHASFTYQPLSEESAQELPVVLRDLNLKIQKGDYIAFTGPSGCGKSTVLKLLMCLYQLDEGACDLEVQGMGASRLTLNQTYRRLFAYVPQGNRLMSGTIREIVAFSDKEGMKQADNIWNALEIACAKEFVAELAQGIDTLLGERGLGLSEGQMQRIAIARAVFADNPILMLDESTSALDEDTETRLLHNLRSMTDKTVLIVTHRPAVLAICDKEICFSQSGVEEKALRRRKQDDCK